MAVIFIKTLIIMFLTLLTLGYHPLMNSIMFCRKID